MPIYMDYHPNVGDVTEEDIKAAHQRDLQVQDKYLNARCRLGFSSLATMSMN